MLPLFELVLGVLSALFLFRLGMPSIFPVLIWVPFLWFFPSWFFVVGLVSASLAWEARFTYLSAHLFPRDWLIGFFGGMLGLFFVSLFDSIQSFLPYFIVPLLLLSLFLFVIHSPQNSFILVGGILLVLGVGWYSLHVWVIPLALPAVLLGFFGSDFELRKSTPTVHNSHPFRDSIIGVLAGILPGLGPGILGALWFSGFTSPSLRVSNLLFSLGFVSLTGAVRSFPAAFLSSFSIPSWEWILGWCATGFFLAYGLSFLFSSSSAFPPFFFFVLHAFVLFLLGGLPTLFLALLAYCSSRLLLHFRLPLSLGSLAMLPSILWFYS